MATAVALIAAGILIFVAYKNDQATKQAAALDALPRIVVPEGHFAPATFEKQEVTTGIKALVVRPGTDIYKKDEADAAAIGKEADAIIAQIKELDFNTLILDTKRGDSVVFGSTKLKSTPVDAVAVLLEKAKAAEITVSLKLNLTGVSGADGVAIDSLMSAANKRTMTNAASELARKYEFDSLQIDSYYTAENGGSYADFIAFGGVGEYSDWLVKSANAAFDEIIKAVKATKSSLPVGICLDNVWQNQNKDNPLTAEGSATTADFEALPDGNVDTKSLVESGMFDFANAIIPTSIPNEKESFGTVVNYWGGICKKKSMPLYVTHSGESAASKELPGWNGTDELSRQVALAVKSGSYAGSAFTGAEALKANPGGSTDYLLKYFRDEIKEDEMFSDLTITSPTKSNFQTYEEEQQFRLSFDPNAEVLLNGEKITPSERGGASVWVPLKVGKNVITLEHKGNVKTYNIERKVVIFQSVSPTAAMKVAGGGSIYVNAMAYKGSKITATLNGSTITLVEGGGGDGNIDSAYVNYEGSFTAPKATKKEQAIGSITFNGTYQGFPESKKGSAITVDKIADDTEPDALTGQSLPIATVSTIYADTYGYMAPTEYPSSIPYQLPYGTKDIVVSQSGGYLNLRSGKTIKASEASVSEEAFAGNNAITGMSVGVEGNKTVMRMTMNWRSPFSITPSPYPTSDLPTNNLASYSFGANTVTILLDYVTAIGEGALSGDMSSSPLFAGMSQEKVKNEARNIYQTKITLPLSSGGRYYGCHAEWEDNTLVLKFNNGGGLSGKVIVVDPGHGGSDNGTMAGRDIVEKYVNLPQAEAIRDALEAMGATVVMTRTSDVAVSYEQRTGAAHNVKADMFISVHHNSAGSNAKPTGSEVYFNTPFSQPLAQSIQAQVNGVMGTTAWSIHKSKNFIVAREKQFPSVLIECGFLSNPSDEARAMDPAHRQAFAAAVAQGISNYYS